MPLPSAEVGRVRLRSGITFAVAGDPVAAELAGLLGGNVVVVDDEHRAAYHAAACIASNHLVALMGQVERVAASAGLDLDAFLGLARAALTDVAELGPAAALTGPAARGDEATLDRHRHTLDAAELPGYDAGVALARRLAARPRRPTTPRRRCRSRALRGAATRRRRARGAERGGTSGGRRPRRARALRVVTGARSSPTSSTPSAPSGAASGSSPPWERCTPGTARSSSGPRRSATSWP